MKFETSELKKDFEIFIIVSERDHNDLKSLSTKNERLESSFEVTIENLL